MTLEGQLVRSTDWAGRVAVVDFFAEYCVPCARMLPSIEALHHARPDLVVLGISEDEDPAAAERVVAARGLTFPVVHDEGHVLAGRFRVGDLPATFVVDGQGLVRWRGAGGDDDATGVRAAVDGVR
jgi:cytochrome c biogenesis protein CcmG/thiol:disulfide interchange protein DsbE